MEQAQKITDLVDNYKKKLTDKQYKDTLEALGELLKVKIPEKEIYVKVIRISCQTTIYMETIKNDDDGQCETELHTDINGFRYEVCNGDCECGECMRDPLNSVEINSGLRTETKWMKVVSDDDLTSNDCIIGRRSFEYLKKSKTYHLNRDILVYLDDNE